MAREMFAEIISTGSEMMLGRLVDTNSAWLSEVLNAGGIKVSRHTAVGDELPLIVKAYQRAWQDHNIIIATGGLGPTEDDLTRQAAAQAFGMELEYHEELAEELRRSFAVRGYILTENNMRQAWLPKGSLLVPNHNGTAPGFAICDENHLMVFLPGVPQEMKPMVSEWFLPQLKERFPSENGLSKTVILKTAGLGESYLDSLIGDLVTPDGNPEIGMLASLDMVRVLVTARGATDAEMEAVLAPVLAELEKRLDGYIFAYDDTTLAEATAALIEKMGLRLSIVDAATQGRLSGLISPALEPENWGGVRELPWQENFSDSSEIFKLYEKLDSMKKPEASPGIRLVCTFSPQVEAGTEGQAAILIECAVQSECINGGRPVIEQIRVGGPRNRALHRAAVLSVFHLWQVLRQAA